MRRAALIAGIAFVILVLLVLLVFIIWALVFPQFVLVQTPTHFLHVTSQSPQPGSVVEWCARRPARRQLPSGDQVLAYPCLRIGWLPFHAETVWASPND